MAYWDTKEDLLVRLASNYYYANYYRGKLAVNKENARVWYNYPPSLSNLYECVGWLLTCLDNTSSLTQYLISRQGAIDPPYNIIYFLSEFTGVTWKSICEAWIKDDFEGRVVTIATIDRMRQILWDEPFSIKWAARPEQQEF